MISGRGLFETLFVATLKSQVFFSPKKPRLRKEIV